MATQTNTPKIFISYSWKPTSNKEKVNKLAERLSADGIHVILDAWDLKLGQDQYSFMEQMVNDKDVKKVLLICNKDYSEKANAKKGGVGVESLIISDDIYKQVDQDKFIPVIFEFIDNKPCTPTFIKTRIFVDLSSDEFFEENYEILIRNIYDSPVSKRPPIGIAPAYITATEPIFLPTAHKVANIKRSLIEEKQIATLLIQDYLDTFIKAIDAFVIDTNEVNQNNFIEIVEKSIENLSALKNDFIDFIDVYTSYSLAIDKDKFHSFFEKLLEYFINHKDAGDHFSSNSMGYLVWDNIRFFYSELFLITTAFLLKKEKFEELGHLLHMPFIVEDKASSRILPYSFVEFKKNIATLNQYKKEKYKLHRVSVTADLIKMRATEKLSFDSLIEADILLYYISLILPSNSNSSYLQAWFPELSCYSKFNTKILPKTKSLRYFNKIKPIFNVEHQSQLIQKVEDAILKDTLSRVYYDIPNIKIGLCINELCQVS